MDRDPWRKGPQGGGNTQQQQQRRPQMGETFTPLTGNKLTQEHIHVISSGETLADTIYQQGTHMCVRPFMWI